MANALSSHVEQPSQYATFDRVESYALNPPVIIWSLGPFIVHCIIKSISLISTLLKVSVSSTSTLNYYESWVLFHVIMVSTERL